MSGMKEVDMNVEIAERLARRRKEAGLSQEELAMKLGVSRQAVSKWERSESSPDTNNLIALAKLYDVSLDDLLYVDSTIADDVEFEMADRARDKAEAQEAERDESSAEDGAGESDTKRAPMFESGPERVHISWRDGINVVDPTKGDRVHVGWDGIHVVDGGEQTDVTWGPEEGININGQQFDSWQDATVYYHGIDVRKNVWLKFPFPLLAVLVYLWLGFAYQQWVLGALVFFSIPLYYLVVEMFVKRSFRTTVNTLYSLSATIWFLWMGLVNDVWHPTWLVFLTIPLFSWLTHALFGRREKARPKPAVGVFVGSSEAGEDSATVSEVEDIVTEATSIVTVVTDAFE